MAVSGRVPFNESLRTGMILTISSMNDGDGVVSLPGLVTGQLLSGASPTIAVHYRIMTMFMLDAATTALGARGVVLLAFCAMKIGQVIRREPLVKTGCQQQALGHCNHDLAELLIGFHVFVRFNHLCEGEGSRHDRLEVTGFEPLGDEILATGESLLIADDLE